MLSLVTTYPLPSCLFPSLPLPDVPAVEETLVRADRLEPEVLPGLECRGGKRGQPFASPFFLPAQGGEKQSSGVSRDKQQHHVFLKDGRGAKLLFGEGR